jgi:hypothetical protein
MHCIRQKRILYTGYFTGDNEPNGIKNAPHNIFSKKAGHFNFSSQLFSEMYGGSHFYSIRLIITREIPCIVYLFTVFSIAGPCHCHLEHKALRQQLFLIVTSQ